MMRIRDLVLGALACAALSSPLRAQFQPMDSAKAGYKFQVDLPADDARLTALKQDAARMVDSMRTFTQQMVDQVFSFGELGFQEEETSRYLTGILEKNGFTVTRAVAGIPTAWVAVWRSPAGAKPVISLGADIDDIPHTINNPGGGWHDPI